MDRAKRFRSGDFVKVEIRGQWVTCKVSNKLNEQIVVYDFFGGKHVLDKSEIYKSNREEWEVQNQTEEKLEIEQGKKEMINGWIDDHTQKNKPRESFDNRKNIKMGLSIPKCKESTSEILGDMSEVLNPVSEVSDETAPEKTKKVKIKPNISKYTKHAEKTTTGKKKMDNDDDVSKFLRSCSTIVDVYAKVFEVLDTMKMNKFNNLGEMIKRYEHLNLGQQRMCAGNLIRGAKSKIGINNLDELSE